MGQYLFNRCHFTVVMIIWIGLYYLYRFHLYFNESAFILQMSSSFDIFSIHYRYIRIIFINHDSFYKFHDYLNGSVFILHMPSLFEWISIHSIDVMTIWIGQHQFLNGSTFNRQISRLFERVSIHLADMIIILMGQDSFLICYLYLNWSKYKDVIFDFYCIPGSRLYIRIRYIYRVHTRSPKSMTDCLRGIGIFFWDWCSIILLDIFSIILLDIFSFLLNVFRL